jgi:hypothetical protein
MTVARLGQQVPEGYVTILYLTYCPFLATFFGRQPAMV